MHINCATFLNSSFASARYVLRLHNPPICDTFSPSTQARLFYKQSSMQITTTYNFSRLQTLIHFKLCRHFQIFLEDRVLTFTYRPHFHLTKETTRIVFQINKASFREISAIPSTRYRRKLMMLTNVNSKFHDCE